MTARTDPFELPASCHPDTRLIHAYWLRARGGRAMPRRANIDPTDMPRHLLPFLSIVDVVADERRYVYRLMGTGEVQVRGFDPTGKSVFEGFLGTDAQDAIRQYDLVVATRGPHLDQRRFVAEGARYRTEEIIFLPLSENDAAVDKIVVFAACTDLLAPEVAFRPAM
jgi:hypothetical protein